MVAVYLSPLYILVNIYIFIRLIQWLKAMNDCFGSRPAQAAVVVLQAAAACAMLIAFFLPAGKLRRVMKLIGNYWLGVMLYTVLALAASDGIRLVLSLFYGLRFSRLAHALCGLLLAAVVAAVSVYGAVNARMIRTTDYEVTVDKQAGKLSSLRMVLIADLHLGYNIGCAHMKRMVEKINAQHPDVVVIAGDIFDNEYEALDDPQRLTDILRGIESTYGVYAVYGNHDVAEKILAGFTFAAKGKKMSDERMDEFLERAGIILLRDEAVLIDGSFYLYGRPDAKRPGRGITTRKTPREITADLDQTKPIFVIDHQPRQLLELADAGVDMDLCGHTHDGQMFPANITTNLMWENACGYLQKGRMHNIVTSGVGLFGPNMRVGTIAEICRIEVTFKSRGSGM